MPDTGGPPAAHAPVRGTRKGKRTFRESTTAGGSASLAARGRGNLTARQNTAVLRRLADLDRENHKDVHIPIVTTKGKELAAKSEYEFCLICFISGDDWAMILMIDRFTK